ncbi:MAG: hypothetical protein JSU08_06920 [Acidobacteria bacterium]|nr:hypothetical protein [Acidobacteriota bacterium]
MADNRCPSCQNDLTSTVNDTIVAMIQADEREPRAVSCPHCGEPLVISARVTSAIDVQV